MMQQLIKDHIRGAIDALSSLYAPDTMMQIERSARLCVHQLNEGHKILLCGNGGSAAQAQHTAAEMIGRLSKMQRPPIPAIALTTDSAILTALANDFSFDDVFARQVEGIGQAGDVLIAISTSGVSKNVLKALSAARAAGMKIIGLVGHKDQTFKEYGCNSIITMPVSLTAHIQEAHLVILHSLCELIENFIHKGTDNACA